MGQVVKTDVKRPRAILSTPVLKASFDDDDIDDSSSNNFGDNNNNDNNNNRNRARSGTMIIAEEDKLRAVLRRGRKLIDSGFISLLDLCEHQRLLMGSAVNILTEDRRMSLLSDVQEHITTLQRSLGVVVVVDKTEDNMDTDDMAKKEEEIRIDRDTLALVLSFSKGKTLLARSLETGLLPHRSACKLLPHVLAVLFANARPNNASLDYVTKEDRLLRSLCGLVKLSNPSLEANDFVSCLDSVMETYRNHKTTTAHGGATTNNQPPPLKKVLSARNRAEVMHTILARGGTVCKPNEGSSMLVNETNNELNIIELGNTWRNLEKEFLELLS